MAGPWTRGLRLVQSAVCQHPGTTPMHCICHNLRIAALMYQIDECPMLQLIVNDNIQIRLFCSNATRPVVPSNSRSRAAASTCDPLIVFNPQKSPGMVPQSSLIFWIAFAYVNTASNTYMAPAVISDFSSCSFPVQ